MADFIFWTVMIGLGIWLIIIKAEKDAIVKLEARKNYLKNPKENENPTKKMGKTTPGATIITAAIVTVMLMIGAIVVNYGNQNPIIGKWQSETSFEFMGKVVDQVEFSSDREYALGLSSKVTYQVEEHQIIVTDEWGIGVIYEMIDKETMRTNIFGIETIYRKIG